MTQEEKLEEAKRLYETANTDQKYVLERLFPELKEIENKRVIQYFKDLAPFDKADELYEKYGFSHKDAIAWLEKQCEQKPSEDEDREYACQSSEHYTRRELMIYNLGIADGKRMIEDAIKETEQNPAWSEEDELKIDFISKLILGLDQEKYDSQCMKELADWLKSLKDRVVPQPKQEWSEEDERMCTKTIFALAGFMGNEDKINWLKSLKDRIQPQPKWSKEDETKINYLIALLQNCTMNNDASRVMNEGIEDWLKSLRPQSQWKPSDEQMRALKGVQEGAFRLDILESLYQDLKKLKG